MSRPFRFEDRAETWFVGVGGTGPFFDSPEGNWVVPLWQRLFDLEEGLPDGVDRSEYLSPCHARQTEFTFYGGFASDRRPQDLPAGLLGFALPGRSYAVGRVRGGRDAIAAIYRELPSWAREQGRPVDATALWLEVYDRRPVLLPEGPFDYEVWLPVT